MQRIAILLACLTCATPGSSEQAPDALNALATLLMAQGPSASFLYSGPGAGLPMGSHARQGQKRFNQRITMADGDEESKDGELSNISPSITEDLLDSLFGDDSLMKKAEAQEEQGEEITTEEDEMDIEEALEMEFKVFDWAEKNFDEEYDLELEKMKKAAKIALEEEKAAAAAQGRVVAELERFDDDKDEDGGVTVKKLRYIDSVIQAQDLQATREKWRLHDQDTGSVSVQIASLTNKIQYLTSHVQRMRKDKSAFRGLSLMVQKRRQLLEYLRDYDREEFNRVTKGLGIRTSRLLVPELQGARRIQGMARDEGLLPPRKTTAEQKALKLKTRAKRMKR